MQQHMMSVARNVLLSLGHLLFRSAIVGLVLAVLVQTGLQVRKYLSNQKTLARTSEFHDQLHLPAISFCLGFVKEKASELPWLTFDKFGEDDDSFPRSAEAAEELWEDITLDAEELGASVMHVDPSGSDLVTHGIANASRTPGYRHRCLRIDERDTLSGKCYTLLWRCPFARDDFLQVNLFDVERFSQSRLRLFFHDPRDTAGLNENFWHAPAVTTSELFLNEFTEVMLRKQVRRHRTSGGSEEGYFRCVQDIVARWEDDARRSTSLCLFPSFRSLLGRVTAERGLTPHCSTATGYQQSLVRDIYQVLNRTSRSACTRPSEQVTYATTQQSQMAVMRKDRTVAFVRFQTMEVLTEEEYVLLDFPAMLAAIGGFAGMTLGWSIKDVFGVFPAMAETGIRWIKSSLR